MGGDTVPSTSVVQESYNLLMGDLVPITKTKGLPISLDHDIFVIQHRKWSCWITSRSSPARDAEASHNHKTKLSEACKRIKKFSTIGVRRVCVTCLDCSTGRGLLQEDKEDWVWHHCISCSDFCEMIFYPHTRVTPAQGQYQQDWCWQWTHRVQKVFYLRHNWDAAKQVFPPEGPCECSLCKPWTRMDREYRLLLNCNILDSLDYDEHETLFKRSRELWQPHWR
ncbi:hypothetical protein B0J14DRAFT_208222 [Halenospora varia]|nr:hypothetical protein B0J14DRAFT_208222 [Halenospora varia]